MLWSRSIAVWPLTSTLTLSTVPSVPGMSRSRSEVSACCEASFDPLPARGIESTSTVWALSVVTSMGACTAPLFRACVRRSATADCTAGLFVSSAWMTTVAGVSAFGNAFSRCFSVAIPGMPGGRSLMPVLWTLKCSAGEAIASRTTTEIDR